MNSSVTRKRAIAMSRTSCFVWGRRTLSHKWPLLNSSCPSSCRGISLHVKPDKQGDRAFWAAAPQRSLFPPLSSRCQAAQAHIVFSACVKSQLPPTLKLRLKEWTEELNRFSTLPRSLYEEKLILPAGPCTALLSLCFTHHIIYILSFLKARHTIFHPGLER